jgi:riboflavin kinase/FMN adenylyltransferase
VAQRRTPAPAEENLMQLIRGLHNINAQHRGNVLTIGNFDGIHKGHQAMLELLQKLAARHQAQSIMMSFRPLPHEYFVPDEVPSRLMNLREKWNALQNISQRPDYLLLATFDEALATLTADEFIESILVQQLAIKAVAVGDDFRFGAQRLGDLKRLQTAGDKYGFEVVALSTHNVDNMRVSSTRIRAALLSDDLAAAENMLGRPYAIEGRVAHGDKRGRTIGFPTANIHLHRPATALDGVYAVTLQTADGEVVKGIANLGKRPTVDGTRKQLEVHLFNFDRDIYGQHVCISFLEKIRDEIKFDSFDALKQQILKDCETAKEILQVNT